MRNVQRFLHRLYHIPTDFSLNRGPVSDDAGSSDIAADLRRLTNDLKAEAFDLERGGVNYARVRTSPTYAAYQHCARQLQVFNLNTLSGQADRLAFWINLYNALIVDAVIQLGIDRSVHDVRGFFWRAAYSIGDRRFSANDIEFGLLRANAPHPAIPGAYFAARDPRVKFKLARREPRIHFALNCASKSCPPINFYAAEKIDHQLDLAARAFINGGGATIDRARREVRLSRIFQWYAPDFGAGWLALGDKSPLLHFIASYVTDDEDREFVLQGKPAVRFVSYDWSLNRAAL